MAGTRLQESTPDYLSQLAPEILRSIFEYFCPHCCNEYQCPYGAPPDPNRVEHNTALYNLCLVSRYFRLSAQEILHHSFDPYYPTWDPPNPWERRLEPFLLTMASRPDLARSVKTLFLKSRLLESLDFDESRKAFDTCARVLRSSSQLLYRKTNKTHLSAIKRAFFLGTRTYTFLRPQDFLPIVGDQLLSVLVAILPSLSHISIEENRRWRFDVSPAALDNMGARSISLKTLEIDHALPNLLARAPGLETLVTSASGEFPNMPCLRNLHIRSKDAVGAPAIEYLLSACTGTLSTFSYTAFDSDIVGIVNLLDKPRFHASLETLHLNMLKIDSKGDHKMPSLKQFTQLKSLFLHTYFLYGPRSPTCCRTECKVKSLFDILPSSITSLDLSERTPTPDGRMYDDLLILSKDAAFAFPQLKEIRSNADPACDEYPQTLFQSVGVDLIYQDPAIFCWIDTVVRIIGGGDCYHYDLEHGGGAMPLPSELSDDDL